MAITQERPTLCNAKKVATSTSKQQGNRNSHAYLVLPTLTYVSSNAKLQDHGEDRSQKVQAHSLCQQMRSATLHIRWDSGGGGHHCMYICFYACMHACMHVCICICICVCECKCICTCVYVYEYV